MVHGVLAKTDGHAEDRVGGLRNNTNDCFILGVCKSKRKTTQNSHKQIIASSNSRILVTLHIYSRVTNPPTNQQKLNHGNITTY